LNIENIKRLFPGTVITLIAALSALYLAEYYNAPVMLFALLLGMALSFLSEDDNCCPGINFSSKTLLRLGVALLGLRISFAQVQSVGLGNLIVISAAVALTMALGVLLARRFNRTRDFGLLTGGSVAICGASAAMAIASVMPGHPDREKQVVFTVLCVTTLSTLAMIVYPIIATQLELSDKDAGVFLGGTIHDVAQVVGAGYSVSERTGDFATITKLYRVLMLVPVFLALAAVFRNKGDTSDAAGSKLPLPLFILGFVGCMLIASFNLLPSLIIEFGLDASKFFLVMAIASLGMKSSPKVLFRGSAGALALVIIETLFLGALILAWLLFGQTAS
jgi:uncharacterized integral membrane protein (TIGR00698 family)